MLCHRWRLTCAVHWCWCVLSSEGNSSSFSARQKQRPLIKMATTSDGGSSGSDNDDDSNNKQKIQILRQSAVRETAGTTAPEFGLYCKCNTAFSSCSVHCISHSWNTGVIGHFSTPPENWTVRAFLQPTPRLSNDFPAAWLTFTFQQLFAVAAILKSIDYNVAMTFILNNKNNNMYVCLTSVTCSSHQLC